MEQNKIKTPEQIAREFLTDFKELEACLAKISGIKDDFISFSRSLNVVNKYKISGVVGRGDNYAFLKAANDLRNLMVHNNAVCYPSPEFVVRFADLAKKIEYPTKWLDIATPNDELMMANYETKVIDLAKQMAKQGVSHVPVLYDGVLIGVFSATTFFDRIINQEKLQIDENSAIENFENEIVLNQHSIETFLFAKPETYVYERIKAFNAKKQSHERRIAALFITDNGRQDGQLLGMVTPADLLKEPLE